MSHNEQTIKLPNWCRILTEGGFEGLAVLFAHRKPFLPTCFVLRTNRPTQRHVFHTLINIDFIAARNIKTSEKRLFSLWSPFFLNIHQRFLQWEKRQKEIMKISLGKWHHGFIRSRTTQIVLLKKNACAGSYLKTKIYFAHSRKNRLYSSFSQLNSMRFLLCKNQSETKWLTLSKKVFSQHGFINIENSNQYPIKNKCSSIEQMFEYWKEIRLISLIQLISSYKVLWKMFGINLQNLDKLV